MCVQCYPDHLKQAVRDAGKQAGMQLATVEPFPVGAVYREFWVEGYNEGLSLVTKAPRKRGKK